MSGDAVREQLQRWRDDLQMHGGKCLESEYDLAALDAAIERLATPQAAPAVPYGIRCDACGGTMAEHDAMARCPAPQAAPADAPKVWPNRLVNWPYPNEPGMRVVGFVVPDDGSPLGDVRGRMERILAQAAPVVQEPVAFMVRRDYEGGGYTEWLFKTRQGAVEWSVDKAPCSIIPLYAHPPVTTDGGGE